MSESLKIIVCIIVVILLALVWTLMVETLLKYLRNSKKKRNEKVIKSSKIDEDN